MPYASDKQRAYLHINEPEIAAKWDDEMKPKKTKKQSINYQKSLADGIRKASASTSTAGSAVGGAG